MYLTILHHWETGQNITSKYATTSNVRYDDNSVIASEGLSSLIALLNLLLYYKLVLMLYIVVVCLLQKTLVVQVGLSSRVSRLTVSCWTGYQRHRPSLSTATVYSTWRQVSVYVVFNKI